jgi:mRNA-degrading endonuclease RelE of RelBE toxin-antitoxin system
MSDDDDDPYKVFIKKKVLKSVLQMPERVQDKFWNLVADLKVQGPMPKGWKNLSKLTGNDYHCHLEYSWVACWSYENGSFRIEVYYVGSREGAPY